MVCFKLHSAKAMELSGELRHYWPPPNRYLRLCLGQDRVCEHACSQGLGSVCLETLAELLRVLRRLRGWKESQAPYGLLCTHHLGTAWPCSSIFGPGVADPCPPHLTPHTTSRPEGTLGPSQPCLLSALGPLANKCPNCSFLASTSQILDDKLARRQYQTD